MEHVELAELKKISAANITALRTAAGMTQADLGAQLNYSDKTISKWERAEAIPDAYVLKCLSELFGVTVDYLLTRHDESEAVPTKNEEVHYSTTVIIALAVMGVLTATIVAFVIVWLLGTFEPRIFLGGVSLSLLIGVILGYVFKKGKVMQYVVAAFVLSIFVLLFFIVPGYTPWQLILIAIPAEIIVFLACNVKRIGKSEKKR